MEEGERRGKPGERASERGSTKNTRKRSLERELDLEETARDPNEGMPKRRADIRPEHQT